MTAATAAAACRLPAPQLRRLWRPSWCALGMRTALAARCRIPGEYCGDWAAVMGRPHRHHQMRELVRHGVAQMVMRLGPAGPKAGSEAPQRHAVAAPRALQMCSEADTVAGQLVAVMRAGWLPQATTPAVLLAGLRWLRL